MPPLAPFILFLVSALSGAAAIYIPLRVYTPLRDVLAIRHYAALTLAIFTAIIQHT